MIAVPTILIADDDPVVRSLMFDVLEEDGFTVIEAEDGVEALDKCRAAVPSLLVVDAIMPNMDGFELVRKLRQVPETQHLPILMATGLDDHDSVARAFEAGATDFISKPLNWLILSQRIRYMLRSASAFDDLRTHQERFAAALGNMSQGLCMFGSDGRLIVSNRRFSEIYKLPNEAVAPGISSGEILRFSPFFFSGGQRAMTERLDEYTALSATRTSAILTQELSDGRVITVTHEPMPDGGSVDTFTDVTEQRLAEAQIAHMAHHDPLTDLPNRVLFRQRLENALHRVPRGEPCAVFCLDLDQFKGVNDTLGHPAGDALLKAVTERLMNTVRQTDTVARLGGDEFAIVQSSADHPRAATNLAARILHELNTPFDVAGHQVVIGTSIGIAVAPGDGTDPDQLLKNADIALYQAKSDGRNCYRYFERAMDAMMQARRELELDLRRAISAHEFLVYFQPLVNLEERAVTGFEALVRWQSPTRGLVAPSDFIPLAEENGLIIQIGEWVLREACRNAVAWPKPLKLAVNISTVQFNSRDLVETVKSALEESGLDPSRLQLEITESVLVEDHEVATRLLHELKGIGVSIAMDDFGTGYSSLSYLRSFPFDKIKIDQSFTRELGNKDDSAAIIRAVTGMCESLGIPVTAEGVETADQLAFLYLEKCTEIQGYLISHPRPAHEISEWIEHHGEEGSHPRNVLVLLDEALQKG